MWLLKFSLPVRRNKNRWNSFSTTWIASCCSLYVVLYETIVNRLHWIQRAALYKRRWNCNIIFHGYSVSIEATHKREAWISSSVKSRSKAFTKLPPLALLLFTFLKGERAANIHYKSFIGYIRIVIYIHKARFKSETSLLWNQCNLI